VFDYNANTIASSFILFLFMPTYTNTLINVAIMHMSVVFFDG